MPWKTLCGFQPTQGTTSLLIPNGAWRPDTVITDTEGNEHFVLLEMDSSMRTYEAIFADLDGSKLVCIKRHVMKAFWKDGYYFCTYRPNYTGQKPYQERDLDEKKIYPHSYVEINPLKGRFHYRFLDDSRQMQRVRLSADNPWLGFMMGCCTCCMRCGRFTAKFKKRDQSVQLFIDQWRNTVKVAPHNDLLAALCMAYIFDKCQNQPMVTMFGADEEDYGDSDKEDAGSIDSGSSGDDSNDDKKKEVEMENLGSFKDEPNKYKSNGYADASPMTTIDEDQSHNDDILDGIPDAAPGIGRYSNSRAGGMDPDGRSVNSQYSQRSQLSQRSQRSQASQRSQVSQRSQASQRSHLSNGSQYSHHSNGSHQSYHSQQSRQSQQSYHTQQSQGSQQQAHRPDPPPIL